MLTAFETATEMGEPASPASVSYPSSTGTGLAIPTLRPLAEGDELDCLLKLETEFKNIRANLKDAISRIKGWLPDWDDRYVQLDGNFSDENTLLRLLELELGREETKLAETQTERTSLQNSLPRKEDGAEGKRSVSYRLRRTEQLAEEEIRHESRILQLKGDLEKQRADVKAHHQKVIPSLSVVNFAHSGRCILEFVEDTISREHREIVRRIPRSISAIEPTTWSRIFSLAVELQEEENHRSLFTGLPLNTVRSPRRVILSISGVCREWHQIAHEDELQVLWQNILVEGSNVDNETPNRRLFPVQDGILRAPISVDLITQSPINFEEKHSSLSRWIQCFEIANLGVVYGNTPPSKIFDIIREVHSKDLLQSLSLMCRDDQFPTSTLLPANIFAAIGYLELVDLNLNISLFNGEMKELTSLRIRYTKPPPYANRLSAVLLRQVLSNTPALEELELELGFEDPPLFPGAPTPPPLENTLLHLRSLKTRLSYFQNRLSFLHSQILPTLDSITLFHTFFHPPHDLWLCPNQLLRSDNLGERIKHLEIDDLVLGRITQFHAPFITSDLRNLQSLALHKQAVDVFVEYLHKQLASPEFPLVSIQNIGLWDASISDEKLLDFIRLYCDTFPQPSTTTLVGENTIGGTPGRVGHRQLRSVEVYRCHHISTSTLNEIACLLRGSGPFWVRVEDSTRLIAT